MHTSVPDIAADTAERVDAFLPVGKCALASRVLCVAVLRVDGWCAYCDAVPGEDHAREYLAVVRHGAKLPGPVARAIWPQFKALRYAQ